MSVFCVFINYYDNSLLPDGTIVNVYPLGQPANNQNLISTGTIGAYPAHQNAGEVLFANLQANQIYYVNFIGNNVPTGSHYMAIGESDISTVPIYHQTNLPSNFTNVASDFVLPQVETVVEITVNDTSNFQINEYVLVTGSNDVFIGIVTAIDSVNNILSIFITKILAGSLNDTINIGAFVTSFAPSDFSGIPGPAGQNGNGSTVTTQIITNPQVDLAYTIPVQNGAAFPNGSSILVSDNNGDTFTAYVSAGGTTQNLVSLVTSISSSGAIFPAGSFVTFTGQEGIQGPQGIQGLVGYTGPQGIQGPPGPGSTTLMLNATCPISGIQSISVLNNTSFPVGSYLLVTDGVSASFSGSVINQSGINSLSINVQQSINPGSIIPAGSTVTFSGPASNVQGPQGLQGPAGPQGPVGQAGHGSSVALFNIPIKPVGTVIQVAAQDSQAFPPLSYVLLSDGIFNLTGQVLANNYATNTMGVRINSIGNGIANLDSLTQPVITFCGTPGPQSTFNVGNKGTVLYEDIAISPPIPFQSRQGIGYASALTTMTILLPSTLPINYRVVVEFDGNVASNQVISNNQVFLGFSSSQKQFAQNPNGTFSRFDANLNPITSINYQNMIADGLFICGMPNSPNSNTHLKYVGTFSYGVQLDFTLVAAAVQQLATFYTQGIMTITCYPIYE